MTRFYARHTPDGEIYAIECEVDIVTGIAGPLHYSEQNDINDHDFDPEDAEWAQVELDALRFQLL